MEQLKESIFEIINNDSDTEHIRLNIINGCSEVFDKYKKHLYEHFNDENKTSIRFYKNWEVLYKDLFFDLKEMSPKWFNLFIFNLNYCRHICNNPKCSNFEKETIGCNNSYKCLNTTCLDEDEYTKELLTVQENLVIEINGIDFIIKEMHDRFDSKYYATVIVSLLDKNVISDIYENVSKTTSPIRSMRYLNYTFDEDEIIEFIYNIIHTHSTQFLKRWSNAIQKLEEFKKTGFVV